MGMKIAFLSLLLATVGFADDGKIVKLDRFPSKLEVQRLKEKKITRLIIAGDSGPFGSRLEYPSGVHVENLNLMNDVFVQIYVDSTAYPSRANARDLSDLGMHAELNLGVRNCLSLMSEADRLLAVEREMRVTTYCNTDRSVQKAKELAAKVMEKAAHLQVTVVRDASALGLE